MYNIIISTKTMNKETNFQNEPQSIKKSLVFSNEAVGELESEWDLNWSEIQILSDSLLNYVNSLLDSTITVWDYNNFSITEDKQYWTYWAQIVSNKNHVLQILTHREKKKEKMEQPIITLSNSTNNIQHSIHYNWKEIWAEYLDFWVDHIELEIPNLVSFMKTILEIVSKHLD